MSSRKGMSIMLCWLSLWSTLLLLPSGVSAFAVYNPMAVVQGGGRRVQPHSSSSLTAPFIMTTTTTTSLQLAVSSSSTTNDNDIAGMRLGAIQAELKEMGVSYADCFDRESLTQRLVEARLMKHNDNEEEEESPSPEEETPETSKTTTTTTTTITQDATTASGTATPSSFNREEVLKELRSMRVKELRAECSQRGIRWGTMIEKEDLVRAVANAMEQTAGFSVSGALEPGKVTEVTGPQLEQELSSSSSSSSLVDTPVLLDVYAKWCGPCKLMAPHLEAAAQELDKRVRVVKIDSDQYPEWSQRLGVGGFPTVVVFQHGKEVQRVEGAVMKDQLLQLVQPYI